MKKLVAATVVACALLVTNAAGASAMTGGGASGAHVPCVARQASRGFPPGAYQRVYHMKRFGYIVVRDAAYNKPCYLGG